MEKTIRNVVLASALVAGGYLLCTYRSQAVDVMGGLCRKATCVVERPLRAFYDWATEDATEDTLQQPSQEQPPQEKVSGLEEKADKK